MSTLKKFWNYLKRHKWSTLLLVISLFVGGYILWDSFSAQLGQVPEISFIKKPKEVKVEAPLSGLLVSTEVAQKTPVAVVIENHPDARPQSGLNQADLVFETFAEGGITRFLAIFQSNETAKEIGPVRSARPYFVEWANSYKALFAHVGGSADALSLISRVKTYDINQFYFGKFFWRDKKRYAPHNVYTTIAQLRTAGKTKNYPTSNKSLPGYEFKKEAEGAQRGVAASFKVMFNSSYFVTYSYSPVDNYYYRAVRGIKHTDRTTTEQIRAKNVLVGFSTFTTGRNKVNIRTTGSGKASFFIDGKRTEGTWKRATGEVMRFYDLSNKQIKLNPGTTWIDFVPVGTAVN